MSDTRSLQRQVLFLVLLTSVGILKKFVHQRLVLVPLGNPCRVVFSCSFDQRSDLEKLGHLVALFTGPFVMPFRVDNVSHVENLEMLPDFGGHFLARQIEPLGSRRWLKGNCKRKKKINKSR